MPHASCLMTRVSCLMSHVSTSHASCFMSHASWICSSHRTNWTQNMNDWQTCRLPSGVPADHASPNRSGWSVLSSLHSEHIIPSTLGSGSCSCHQLALCHIALLGLSRAANKPSTVVWGDGLPSFLTHIHTFKHYSHKHTHLNIIQTPTIITFLVYINNGTKRNMQLYLQLLRQYCKLIHAFWRFSTHPFYSSSEQRPFCACGAAFWSDWSRGKVSAVWELARHLGILSFHL